MRDLLRERFLADRHPTETVFLNKDRTLAKIGDFGMARELKDEEWATSFCGVSELSMIALQVGQDRNVHHRLINLFVLPLRPLPTWRPRSW